MPVDEKSRSAGGTLGGSDGCVEATSTPVAWTEKTEWGTPDALFAPFAGSCEAPLSWDGSGWTSMLTVTPATGRSTAAATVKIDPASVKLVEYEPAESGTRMGDAEICSPALEATATVSLELPEGSIAEGLATTIALREGIATSIGLVVDQSDFGDWVTISSNSDGTAASMLIRMAPLAEACTGDILLSAETETASEGSGVAQSAAGTAGSFASWSDTGCGIGEAAVNLLEPFGGVDLIAAVAQAYGEATYRGMWREGEATTLSLRTTITENDLCAEPFGDTTVVTIPVSVEANSADGRVTDLSGAGTIRVSVPASGAPDLQLWLSTDLVCASEADSLAYRGVDCASVQRVTAQLGLNDYAGGGAESTDGGRLELYVYERSSSAAPGAADSVAELVLTP